MDEKTPPANDKTWNPKIEGANPESVDVDVPEQGEPEDRNRSRMAEPTPRSASSRGGRTKSARQTMHRNKSATTMRRHAVEGVTATPRRATA